VLLGQPALLRGAVLIGALLVFESLLRLINARHSGSQARVNRRMQMLADGRTPREILASLRRDPRTEDIFGVLPGLGSLDRLLARAGVSAPVERALLWMLLCGALSFTLLRLAIGLTSLLALSLAALAGIGLPVLHLIRCRARRLRRFETQLPDALDLLAHRLRAGDPFVSALAEVAEAMPDPLGSEVGIVSDEVAYGQSVDQALARLSERIDLPDLRYLTVAAQIHRGSGDDLAEALGGLAGLIRDRVPIPRNVHAITAGSRRSS
jgi:tight adherence protein B